MESNMTNGWENSSLISFDEVVMTGSSDGRVNFENLSWINFTNITSNQTTQDDLGDDMKKVNLILAPILTGLGTIGNILTLCVLSRPKFAHMSISVYMRTLAVIDTIFLWVSNNMMLIFETKSSFSSTQDWACKIWMWLHISLPWISSWLLVALSIERVIAIRFPHKARIWCTKKKAIFWATFTCVFFMILDIHILVLFDTSSIPGKCTTGHEIHKLALDISAILIYSTIPAVAITICNTVIIKTIIKAARERKNISETKPSTDKSNTNITIMLIINSYVFIILTMPINVYVYLEYVIDFGESSSDISFALGLVSNLNHAINFVLYSVSGSQFRSELVDMFCCNKKSSTKAAISSATSLSQLSEASYSVKY